MGCINGNDCLEQTPNSPCKDCGGGCKDVILSDCVKISEIDTNCIGVSKGDTLTSALNDIFTNTCGEWIALTPTASDYQEGNNPLMYMKLGNTVKIRGTISKITSTQNAGVTVNLSATPLPTGYRPLVTWNWYHINTLGNCVNIFITSNGYIQIKPLVSNMTVGAGFDVNIEFTTI